MCPVPAGSQRSCGVASVAGLDAVNGRERVVTRPRWGFIVLLDTTLLLYLVISNKLAVPARAAAAFRARRRPSALTRSLGEEPDLSDLRPRVAPLPSRNRMTAVHHRRGI
jgi:hypothetical protein